MWCIQSNRVNQQALELVTFLWVVAYLTPFKEALLFWVGFGEYPMRTLFLCSLLLGSLNVSSEDSNSDWDFLEVQW